MIKLLVIAGVVIILFAIISLLALMSINDEWGQ